MVDEFRFSRTPYLNFGRGSLHSLPDHICKYRGKALIITGKNSFASSTHWVRLQEEMNERKIQWYHETVDHEPSPDLIDNFTSKYIAEEIAAVVGIGGGSVLDAGKAVSAMLGKTESIRDYLEGIGAGKAHDGSKKPYIAIPTTSGTGTEATKNAVLSESGPDGFKKSLRHDNIVPDYAILDPELTLNCPQRITSASGMDAFTQLLEPYVSPKASDLTDLFALKGILYISKNLEKAWQDGGSIEARSGMMMAAFHSGISLANAGLGVVHGFASSIGGMFEIPHGVVCGTLMGASNRVTIRKLRKLKIDCALKKYASAGKIFANNENLGQDYYIDLLMERIYSWTEEFGLSKLAEFGIQKDHIPAIVGKTASRDNPVELEAEELVEILEERL